MIEHLLNDFSGVSIKLLAYIVTTYILHAYTCMNINEAENLDDFCKAVRTDDTDSLINDEVHDYAFS